MGGSDHHSVNRLKGRYFTVEIAGDVDHYTPADHVAENTAANALPTTKAASLIKERAHMRWKAIAMMLGERHVPVVRDLVGTGRGDDVPATSLDFVVSYDREDYIITFDEENSDIPMGPASAFNPGWTDGVEFTEATEAEVIQRTWERGSGETMACGTGASAVCVAGFLTGKTNRELLVHLSGGDLEIHYNEEDNHIYKFGPAQEVFQGTWEH